MLMRNVKKSRLYFPSESIIVCQKRRKCDFESANSNELFLTHLESWVSFELESASGELGFSFLFCFSCKVFVGFRG